MDIWTHTHTHTLGPRGILSGLRFVVENKKELCIAVDAKERERAAMMTRGRNASTRTRRVELGVCLSKRNVSVFGGYEPLTNVIEHSEIDLDLINIMGNLGETCGASCELEDCSGTPGCKYDGSVMGPCQWGVDKVLPSGTFCNDTSNAYDIWREGQEFPILLLGLQQKAAVPVFRTGITSTCHHEQVLGK